MPTNKEVSPKESAENQLATRQARINFSKLKIEEILNHPPILPKVEEKEKHVLTRILRDIPFLTGILTSLDKTGLYLGKVFQIVGDNPSQAEAVTSGFQYASIVLNFINFIRIPLIFLASYVLGQEPPITLSKTAQWSYAGVLLGLAIFSLALPALAPYIAVATASLVLGVSLFTLGRFIYKGFQQKKAIQALTTKIDIAEEELKNIVKNLKLCEKELDNPDNQQAIGKVSALSLKFQDKKESLQTLLNEREKLKIKFNKRDLAAVTNRLIGIILASVTVIGAVVCLFALPLGLSILTAAAMVGLGYVMARIVGPKLLTISKSIFGKLANKIESLLGEENQNSHAFGEKKSLSLPTETLTSVSKPFLEKGTPGDINLSPNLEKNASHEVSTEALSTLDGHSILAEQGNDKFAHQQWEDEIKICVLNKDIKGVLKMFVELSKQNVPEEELLYCLANDACQQGITILGVAIKAVLENTLEFSNEDKKQLLSSPVLEKELLQYGVNLHQLAAAPEVSPNLSTPLSKDDEDENESPTVIHNND